MKNDPFEPANLSIRLALTLGAALGGLSLIQSSWSADDYGAGMYGRAPESLDYPTGLAKGSGENQYGKAAPSLASATKKKLAAKNLSKELPVSKPVARNRW